MKDLVPYDSRVAFVNSAIFRFKKVWKEGVKVNGVTLTFITLALFFSGFVVITKPIEKTVYKTVTRYKVDTFLRVDTVTRLIIPKETLKPSFKMDEKVKKVKLEEKKEEKKEKKEVTRETSSTLHGYDLWAIAIWILKAEENFSPKDYPDGKHRSKGFGLNLTYHAKWASKKLGFDCKKRDWTYSEAEMLLKEFYAEHKKKVEAKFPHYNQMQITALTLNLYNTGNTNSLYRCCGAQKDCGSSNKNVRKVHDHRRSIERKIFNGKLTKSEIESYRLRAAAINSKHK